MLSGAYGTDYIDNLAYYKNNGTSEQHDFQLVTMNLLPGLDLISGSVPVLADMDGDNDIDLLSSSYEDDKISWYEQSPSLVFTEHIISSSEDKS